MISLELDQVQRQHNWLIDLDDNVQYWSADVEGICGMFTVPNHLLWFFLSFV